MYFNQSLSLCDKFESVDVHIGLLIGLTPNQPEGYTQSSSLVLFPQEVLVEIFKEVIQGDARGQYWCYTSRLWDSRRVWATLTRISGVCRRWRAIVVNAPTLWREINLDATVVPQSITDEMLRRTRNAPVHITFSGKSDVEALDTVRRELHRTECLRYLYSKRGDPGPGLDDAPVLRELVIDTLSYVVVNRDVPMISPLRSLPYLKYLRAKSMYLKRILPFFRSTITHLSLESCLGLTSDAVLDFLVALKEMSLLQELWVYDCFLSVERSSLAFPTVTLPLAQKICICDHSVACVDILNHLVFPVSLMTGPNAGFHVSESNSLRDGDLFRLADESMFMELLASIFSKLSGHGVIGDIPLYPNLTISSYQFFFVSYWDWETSVELSNAETSLFQYTISRPPTGARVLETLCSSSLKSLLTSIRTATLTANCQDDGYWSPTLAAVLPDLTNLDNLHLESWHGVWRGIASIHREYEKRKESSSPMPFPFPRLRSLSLTRANFRKKGRSNHPQYADIDDEEDYLRLLQDMVRIRKEAGFPLHSLTLYSPTHLYEDDIQMLQEFVKTVLWDWSPFELFPF